MLLMHSQRNTGNLHRPLCGYSCLCLLWKSTGMVTHLFRKFLKEVIEGDPQSWKNDMGVRIWTAGIVKKSWRLTYYFLNRNKT